VFAQALEASVQVRANAWQEQRLEPQALILELANAGIY